MAIRLQQSFVNLDCAVFGQTNDVSTKRERSKGGGRGLLRQPGGAAHPRCGQPDGGQEDLPSDHRLATTGLATTDHGHPPRVDYRSLTASTIPPHE